MYLIDLVTNRENVDKVPIFKFGEVDYHFMKPYVKMLLLRRLTSRERGLADRHKSVLLMIRRWKLFICLYDSRKLLM